MKRGKHDKARRILGRVRRDEFVGRTPELERLIAHASSDSQRELLLLLAPLAGVSELFRQAYDALFNARGETVPIYFCLPANGPTPVSAAIEFLNTFLTQYIAFQRNEPALCQSLHTLTDLIDLAPAADAAWVEQLVNTYNKQRFSNDDTEFVRFCLTAPNRVPPKSGRAFVMFDATQLGAYADSPVPFAKEMMRSLTLSQFPFALAGLRRELLIEVEAVTGSNHEFQTIHLDRLNENDARLLITSAAQREQVTITEETRDLLVQQMECSPFLITSILKAAREKTVSLESYLSGERLYVNELLGGRLHRYFSSTMERIAPDPDTRRSLVRLLCEAIRPGSRSSSLEAWRRHLKLTAAEADELVSRLHAEELVNRDGDNINTHDAPVPWRDYLRARFRLDDLREPRALVVADLMADSLKRAPQTIAKHYRHSARLRLLEVVGQFSAQLVPKVLLDYVSFAADYKGAELEEIVTRLEDDTSLVRLPQMFHAAPAASFSRSLMEFVDEESVVAHGFEGLAYTDANEVVWLVARVEHKLEVEEPLANEWRSRLEDLARKALFEHVQIWLIATEGFTSDAAHSLRQHGVYFSNQRQFELLAAKLTTSAPENAANVAEAIELVVPMGSDFELLAANTVEQVARRLAFRPEAINQIKTAIVEACINASEHSLSPDRKIYQRFWVEDDRLVVTIASRGVVPANLNGQPVATEDAPRRGWGLKLIKTLMDEVEFQRVDEGTSLRMTKYVRN